MKHEHTHHVAADADKVYAALADIRNLPHYVPQMTKAEPHDGDKVTVEARYQGHTQHGEGWFKTDDDKRRIEWGAEGSAYNGWLQVDPDEDGVAADAVRRDGARRRARPRGHGHARRDPPPRRSRRLAKSVTKPHPSRYWGVWRPGVMNAC